MSTFCLIQGDAAKIPLHDQSVDMVFTSPYYMDARTYGIGIKQGCDEWVQSMLIVVKESLRVSRGPVMMVCAGVTRDWNYWPGPEGLMYEAFRAGIHAFRPCFFHRRGIPGSGGKQWYRADTEYVLCFKRPGKLPWAEPTANGHKPKWGPGGEMSHRLKSGERVNQWGKVTSSGRGRRANGKLKRGESPSHVIMRVTGGTGPTGEALPNVNKPFPAIANPGNVVPMNVGGGHMGHKLASQNEAPFPVQLPSWFIRSHCPPGGIVLDPFCGSGTTGQAALELGRRFIGIDIRQSQIELSRRRLGEFGTEFQGPAKESA